MQTTRPDLTARQLVALRARIDFATFARCVYLPYRIAAHLRLINQALAQVARFVETNGAEGISRLRIEMPPRHGKSQTAARLFPTWFLGRNPDRRVIVSSHSAQLSEGHSRFIRNTMRGNAFASIFPRVQLAADSQARDTWDLEAPHEGGLLAVGTGGSVTGRGASLIICDDLVKSREEAENDQAREKLEAWFTDDLLTRQEPHAAIVAIGTRWHVDDILGRLEIKAAGRWTVLRLPALAEENDPLGRQPGEALWPERFDETALAAQRADMSEYAFQALYQQAPVSSAGGIFQRSKFNFIDAAPPDLKSVVRFWDLALSEKTTADRTAGCKFGLTEGGRFVILHVEKFRQSWKDAQDKITSTALLDGPEVRMGVETVLFQVAAVEELVRRRELHSYSIKGYAPHKDKVTRALPLAARVDAGLVDVVRGSWTQDFIDELCSFPGGKHDDQVDGATGAYTMLADQPRTAAIYVGSKLIYEGD